MRPGFCGTGGRLLQCLLRLSAGPFGRAQRHDALGRGHPQPRQDEGQHLPRQRPAHDEQKAHLQQPERALRQDRRVPQQGPDHRGERLSDDRRGQDVPSALFRRTP